MNPTLCQKCGHVHLAWISCYGAAKNRAEFGEIGGNLEHHNDEYESPVPDTVLAMNTTVALPRILPTLNPMPGRVIVQLVDRLTEFPNSALVMDPRYQYQPYIGKIVAFGDALDDEEGLLLNAARERTAAGERFVFTWGNGTDYSTPQMMEFRGKDGRPRFEWLAKLRVFRIKDLAASISGGDELGGSDV